MCSNTSWPRFASLLILWTLLLTATFTVLLMMVPEVVEASKLLKAINTTTPYLEKLALIAQSSAHVLLAMLYAILLLILVVLDIEVARELANTNPFS
jgi:hypothetical protein